MAKERQEKPGGEKSERKRKPLPEGYEHWTPNRKALYRAAGYVKRLRGLLRSAPSNLDDAAVLAAGGGAELSHDEWRQLRLLQAESNVAIQHMQTAMNLLIGCCTELERRTDNNGPRMPAA